MSNYIRAISDDGSLTVTVIDSTKIVQKMEQLHETSAVISAALGRLLTAASLMGINAKEKENNITLRVNGGGPAGTLLVVSDGAGNVRGYADHPVVEIPLREDGKLNVGGAVGDDGTLSVVRDTGFGEPYIGQIPLASGEIAEDITAYFAASEQSPSVCALGVLVDKNLTIRAAGGYLLQLLPNADDDLINTLEKNLSKIDSVTNMLDNNLKPSDILQLLLNKIPYHYIGEGETEYRCNCSENKTKEILSSLGQKELQKMMQEKPTAEVECHFCNKVYHVGLEELLTNTSKTI